MNVSIQTCSNSAAGVCPSSGCLHLFFLTEPFLLLFYLGHDNELPALVSHCAAIDNSYDLQRGIIFKCQIILPSCSQTRYFLLFKMTTGLTYIYILEFAAEIATVHV